MFRKETQGLSCVRPFPFSLSSLEAGSLTLPGGGALPSQGGPERQVREGGVGMITKQPHVVDGTGWTLGSAWLLLPSDLSPSACPLTAARRVGRLCPLPPEPPASSSVLLLPPGAHHTWSRRLSHQVTSLPSENLVAHLPRRAGPSPTGSLEWNSPQGSSTDCNRDEPWEGLGFRVKGGIGKFLRAMPRGRTGLALGWGRSRVGKRGWEVFSAPRAGQAGAPGCPSPSLQPRLRAQGTVATGYRGLGLGSPA